MQLRLEGPVWVAFTQEEKAFYATALQFDLVGTGSTREIAFTELQEMFRIYVQAVLAKPGKVQFVFPSEASEWDNPDIEYYDVIVDVRSTSHSKPAPSRTKLKELRRYRDRINTIQFQPAC